MFKRIHGGYGTAEYRVWNNMLFRSIHGKKTFDVDERWRSSFEIFLKDIGPRPTPNHIFTRINKRKDYTPDNCRWERLNTTSKIEPKPKKQLYKPSSKSSIWSLVISI